MSKPTLFATVAAIMSCRAGVGGGGEGLEGGFFGGGGGVYVGRAGRDDELAAVELLAEDGIRHAAYSAVMPPRCATSDHFFVSLARKARNSAGGGCVMPAPWSCICFCTAGSAVTFFRSWLTCATIGAGRPAGPNRPYQLSDSTPFKPASLKVIASGNSGMRRSAA